MSETSGGGGAGRIAAEDRIAALEAENERLRARIAELGPVAARESQMRHVADALPVLLSYIDREHRYRFNNRAYEQWVGHDRKQLLGMHLSEALGPDAYAELAPLVEKALAGERVSVERKLPYRDGGTRTVQIDHMPDRREDGSVAGLFSLVRDVSERARVEEQLRESEARYREVFQNAGVGMIEIDADWNILASNAAYCRITGRVEGEMLGANCLSFTHPEDVDIGARALRSLAAGEIDQISFEKRYLRPDGTVIWVRSNLSRVSPEKGDNRFLKVVEDITEMRAAREALRESEARFRAMADSAPSPVWVTGPRGIEFANRAFEEVAGVPAGQLTGEYWMAMIHPDELDRVMAMRSAAWADKAAYGYEARFRHASGDYRWMRVACRPRFDPAGELLGYVGLAVDMDDVHRAEQALKELNQSLEARVAAAIEEREQAEEALRQSQKMEAVGQLTGGIAHDFNNLLTIITGNIDAARRHIGAEGEARVQRALGNALIGAERAATLTQRLLAFSRRQPLSPRPVDANKLVGGMSDLLHSTLGETIAIETVLAAGLWRVEADPHQLENAILNLAVNARDAMPSGGKLTIETSNTHFDRDYAALNPGAAPGQYVTICVSDTGVGIAEETLERVFEPFFTTKEVGKGTGLGLSMVYGFVKQSGGHVKIYSEAGHGTTVRIYLPRLVDGDAEEVAAGDDRAPEGSHDETVLVCEDDDDVRAYSVEVLRELGYRVLEARDGPSALDLLQRQEKRVDLLFTDVVLPGGMTGATLAVEGRALRPDLKVLFTTGYARNAIVHHGRLDPGVELITKPFSYADLAARVRDMLDRN